MLRHKMAAVHASWGVCRLQQGQTTVEYVMVALAFMALTIALTTLWHAARDGKMLKLAIDAGSHSAGNEGMAGALRDVALFLIPQGRCW